MRVVVVGGYAPSLINFRRELLEALVAAGHDVVACASEDDPAIGRALGEIGVTYQPIPLSRTGANPLDDLKTLHRFYRTWRRLQPDLVLAYTIKPVAYGLFAARLAGVDRRYALITGLGSGLVEAHGASGRLKKALALFVYRRGLKGAKAVFFQNPDNQAFFERQKLIGAAERRVLVNGSGVNLDRFTPSVPDVSRPTFLLIARLLIDKGIREYAAAARLVKARHPDARFLLLGPTDQSPKSQPALEREAWEREGLIVYLGTTDDVRSPIRAASVYVLPSYHEGTPRSTLEAMAMGRAVITTDVPGCRETVVHGENGLLVPARDPEALADAMMTLIRRPEQVLAMGRASRKLVEEQFDVHKVNQTILTALGIDWPARAPSARSTAGSCGPTDRLGPAETSGHDHQSGRSFGRADASDLAPIWMPAPGDTGRP